MKIQFLVPIKDTGYIYPEIVYKNKYYFKDDNNGLGWEYNWEGNRTDYDYLLREADEIDMLLHSEYIEDFKQWIKNEI